MNRLGAGYRSTNALNNDLEILEEALDNTLSRDGSGPNQMEAPIDMNDNRIINLPEPVEDKDAVRLMDIQPIIGEVALGKLNTTGDNALAGFLTNIGALASTTFTSFVSGLLTSAGSAAVGYAATGTGAVTRDIQAKLREMPVSVKDFGAVGDGVTDDAPAIRAARDASAGRSLFFPTPAVAYLCNSPLGTITNTRWFAEGKRYIKIKKGYSGVGLADPLLILGDGAEVSGLQFDFDAPTRTGLGWKVLNGQGNQIVRDVSLIKGDTSCIYFEKDAGSRWTADNLQASCFDVTKPAVEIEDVATGGNPRSFHRFETDGAKSFKTGGANNLYVSNSSVFDIDFSVNSFDVTFSNCRMAGTSGYLLKGSGAIMGGAIGPLLTIDVGATYNVCPGYSNSDIVDNSGGTSLVTSARIQTYVPVMSAGGVPITLGDGTLIGRYSRAGKLVFCKVRFIPGASTVIGAGALTVTLPIATSADLRSVGGVVDIQSSGGTPFMGFTKIAALASTMGLFRDTGGAVTNAAPGALAVGANIHITVTYET